MEEEEEEEQQEKKKRGGRRRWEKKKKRSYSEEWDVRETTMQTPRSVKKEREVVCRSRDSPAARGEVAGCPPAAHGG